MRKLRGNGELVGLHPRGPQKTSEGDTFLRRVLTARFAKRNHPLIRRTSWKFVELCRHVRTVFGTSYGQPAPQMPSPSRQRTVSARSTRGRRLGGGSPPRWRTTTSSLEGGVGAKHLVGGEEVRRVRHALRLPYFVEADVPAGGSYFSPPEAARTPILETFGMEQIEPRSVGEGLTRASL